jgi:hypothetical protein
MSFSFLIIFMLTYRLPAQLSGQEVFNSFAAAQQCGIFEGKRPEQDGYFFKFSSIALFIASKTPASAASFATRTALLIANASERP